ncbi:MAG: hypothetical protein PHO51_02045 [Bacteroidales bacterium]|nr:hypothetical protein [Bacteroidales bacterium]MDD4617912.1 hypothetical protein [Bacteroidales bacterium]
MKQKGILTILAVIISGYVFGQEQPPQKTPVEIAAEQANRLQRDLDLDYYQVFKVDSTLQTDLAGVMAEFEKMKKGGLQNPESYREVQKRWQDKTEESFYKIMTPEQFERYLKIIGTPKKERKKKLEQLEKKKESGSK